MGFLRTPNPKTGATGGSGSIRRTGHPVVDAAMMGKSKVMPKGAVRKMPAHGGSGRKVMRGK
jgi:hypothetical protein